jgi:hypothetical protein
MSSHGRGQSLRGRASECETLRGLISTVQSGSCQVLVLRGEAGVGKTALLEYISERASGFRCVEVAGVQWDMELAFAGLQQLCAPLVDKVGELPEPQARGAGRGVRSRYRAHPGSFLGRAEPDRGRRPRPTSAAKATGAAGLLVGLFVPVIGVMAAIGLVLYFIGAVVTVVRPRVYSRSAVLLLL